MRNRILHFFLENSFLHVAAVFLISLLIFARKFFTPGISWWADMTTPVLNMSAFGDLANFLYIDKSSGLVFNPIYTLLYFFLHKFFLVISLVTSPKLLGDLINSGNATHS